MQDFPPNSAKAKGTDTSRENLQPVTSAEARGRKKRGLGRQFKRTFFGGNAREAGEHMVTDVVVPAIRDMLYDAMQSGLDRLIYGERASSKSRSRSIVSQNLGHFSYDSVSKPTRANQPSARTLSKSARARHSLEELVIPTMSEANEVIDRMFDILSQSGDVTVADLYTLTGIRPDHTDNKWGWYNLKGAKAVRLRQGGFLLDLPEPEPLG